jgi:2-dehydro-3-deoxyphosphogluconate aldolase/(4S)-4-hydroxy-2-oxoglutarate aldolase
MHVSEIMTLAPVIPVLVIDDVDYARPIAEALVAGGLYALEVTLRTPAALDVIREMAKVEGAVVGAGTVINEAGLKASIDAGARFIVSPGLTESLARPAIESGIPFLPGIATAADLMRGLDLGLDHFKFFPAEANGGVPALKALTGPFPQCRFCPTGGVTPGNAREWLSIDAVLCVGGSWVVPRGAPDRATITALAKAAATLCA